MVKTMKAAVIQAPHSNIEIQQRARPTPAAGEVLIRVHACGVCHGDLMVQQGAFPFAPYPIVPGHEIAGVIEVVGDQVRTVKIGDRVGISALFSSCGNCHLCHQGDEFLCPHMQFTGVTKDGGYAEFMLAPAGYAVPLPAKLDFANAAPLMCAGLTVFSALRHADFRPGQKVAVTGLGGLGHMAVLFARAMGARVAVLSSSAEKKEEAFSLGAERFINVKVENAAEALRSWDGGADMILHTASANAPAEAAFAGLSPNGTLVILGVGPGSLTIDPMNLIMGRRRIMGSPAGSRNDLRDTLEFAASNNIRPRMRTFALEQAAQALALMHEGHLAGRAVLQITDPS